MSFPYDRIVSNWLSLDREKKRERGGGEKEGEHIGIGRNTWCVLVIASGQDRPPSATITANSRQYHRHRRRHDRVQRSGDAARSDPAPPGTAAAPTSSVTDDADADGDGVAMVSHVHEHYWPPAGPMSSGTA